MLMSEHAVKRQKSEHTQPVTLRDGAKMPAIGAGTYVGDAKGHTSPQDCAALVATALKAGYRHFDSALMYQNEAELGNALRGADGVVPSHYFVTTKVAHPNDPSRGHTACAYMDNPDIDATQGVLRNVHECCARLRLGRPVDLVLLHWPGLFGSENAEFNENKRWAMWQGLEQAKEQGLCNSIGVSSFSIKHLEQLLARGPQIMPAVNQIEVSPCHRNWDLTKFCQDHGIQVCAWSPFGLGNALHAAPIIDIAERHLSTAAAVLVRWLVQRHIVPLPRSVKEEHLINNFHAAMEPGFTLTDAELHAIDALDEGSSVFGGRNTLAASIA
mmetsp:Transcript_55167/g.118513  ORF Transcript_55167/g.118513 Transcript_55167/m.118513 type:complete len:328 (-) Transcript_55167:38-1021(-)